MSTSEASTLLSCLKCGTKVEAADRFCGRCGAALKESPVAERASPHFQEVPTSGIQAARKRPWYFSAPCLVATFCFFNPLWAVLVLVDKEKKVITKVLAATLGLISTLFLVGLFLDASFSSIVYGPTAIEFGNKYVESPGNVSLVGKRSDFSKTEPVAWITHLRGAVRTTSVDLYLSKLTESGGEIVLAKNPIYIANPAADVIFGIVNPFTLALAGRGRYRLRLTLKDRVLGEGEFEVD